METNKQWFIDNYLNTDHSLYSLADKIGLSYSGLYKRFKKTGLKAKSAGEAGKKNLIHYKPGNKTWNKGLTKETDARQRQAGINSAKTRKELGSNKGENHYNWKGDEVSYKRLHTWINNWKGKATICIKCGASKDCQWANISGEYKRDLNDYISLCRDCHTKYDVENRTHCRKGHLRTEENTYWYPNGGRRCKLCNKEYYESRN